MGYPLIEFKDVIKRFGDQTVLDGVNLTIQKGHVTTIIGKSGVGKTVLLKHIIGLMAPDEGTIHFQGKPLSQMTKEEKNAQVAKISYMFQNNALFDSMTVFENVAMPLRQTTAMDGKTIHKKVMESIEQTELAHVAHRYPGQLSGGMQKRVALSRALVTEPEIVLFDEPTTGQDPVRRNAILGMIAGYQRRFGFTAVLISHDIPDVFFISNRILILYKGKIIFQGTPEKFDDFHHPFVDEFVTSLEIMQKNLSGLYSRRTFKVRYQKMLGHERLNHFVLALFALEHYEKIGEMVGHVTAQKVVSALGSLIHEHFDTMGGFSTRQSSGVFITVLPFSDMDEAKGILDEFGQNLKEKGLANIRGSARIEDEPCFDFALSAGLAEGRFNDEIEMLIQKAQSQQKMLVRFQCDMEQSVDLRLS
jgi:phospholipid/cholesterol/gamma-HCH transport system ATP-binding protein